MSINLNDIGLSANDKTIKISTLTPVFCYGTNKIKDVIEMIVFTGHRRIPIVSKDKEVLGILTKSDILDAFLRKEDFDERVTEIMNRDVITCNENDDIEHTLNRFKISRRGGFPLISNNKLVGMVSERDFIKKVAGIDTGTKAKDIMTNKPFIIRPNINIGDGFRTMVNTRYRRLPVVKDGIPIGVVTSEDLLRFIYKTNYDFGKMNDGIEHAIVKEIKTIGPDVDAGEIAKKMVEHQIGGLVVVDENRKLTGLVTERDILEIIELK
jgi:predicted transcriptional regulator